MDLAIFDLDNTLLGGDSDYLWGQFLGENGYVETILHRRRKIMNLKGKNISKRNQAERLAVNTVIQGSAADIIKIAMIKIHQKLSEQQLRSKMILQVHDELVFDVLKTELEQVKHIVIKEMESAFKIDVTLTVDSGTGENWLNAH